jgi:hypothetical protein
MLSVQLNEYTVIHRDDSWVLTNVTEKYNTVSIFFPMSEAELSFTSLVATYMATQCHKPGVQH